MFYYFDYRYGNRIGRVGICKSKRTRDTYYALFFPHCEKITSRTARKYLVAEMLSYGLSRYDEIDVPTLSMRELCDEVRRLREMMGGE